MLDMGFREELEEILDATPDGRRTLLFSATMPKPIAALARAYQRDALKIVTTGTDRGHGDIAYQAIAVAPNDIEHSVVNLLRFHESDIAIVFCATRESVRRLHASLIERGFDAVALSGEHSQNERNHAMQALRDRRARVCVATDVAARGIDLTDLRLVIHADIPRDAETLQHRSGRTGRAGKKGTAVLIVPFTRRKRVEGMLRGEVGNGQNVWGRVGCGVKKVTGVSIVPLTRRKQVAGMMRSYKNCAAWIAAQSLEDMRVGEIVGLVEVWLQSVELDDNDRQLAARLVEKRSAEGIADAV